MLQKFQLNKWVWKKEGIGIALQEVSKACQELVKCFCEKICNTWCKCKKFELPCTELCMCSGGC